MSESAECRGLVEEARLYHLLPDRRSSVCCERTRARRSAGTVQVIVSVGGEDDKVGCCLEFQKFSESNALISI